jgi:hypothetical protein
MGARIAAREYAGLVVLMPTATAWLRLRPVRSVSVAVISDIGAIMSVSGPARAVS